jgi:alpha-beta hydrolase superfamily lysophospholipase
MSGPTTTTTYAQAPLARGALTLALHAWSCPEPHTVVFYVHGTQSHAGWMFETGPALAGLGCVVYALDRRGSGASEGARGDAGSYHEWIEDYLAAMARVRERHPGLPMLLNGQSFGGAIAAGVACDPRASHDALLLCSPLLAARAGFDLWQGVADDVPVRIPAPDTWFTSDPRYLDFIARDPLMVRAITRRFHDARLRLGEHYLSQGAPLAGRPCALVIPRTDPMVDLAGARDVFGRLTGGSGMVIELPGNDHYLEFSPGRPLLWRLQASFARTFAPPRGAS